MFSEELLEEVWLVCVVELLIRFVLADADMVQYK